MNRLTLLISLFILVVVNPSFSADFQKGMYAASQGDFETALKEFEPLAEHGHSGAQTFLGAMFNSGNGVPKDYKKAVKWFLLAAEQGDVKAQNFLAKSYYYGKGVKQDYREALKWKR